MLGKMRRWFDWPEKRVGEEHAGWVERACWSFDADGALMWVAAGVDGLTSYGGDGVMQASRLGGLETIARSMHNCEADSAVRAAAARGMLSRDCDGVDAGRMLADGVCEAVHPSRGTCVYVLAPTQDGRVTYRRVECASLSECTLESDTTVCLAGGVLEDHSGWYSRIYLASPSMASALFEAVCRGMTRSWGAVVALDAQGSGGGGATACIEGDGVLGLRYGCTVHRRALRLFRAVRADASSGVVVLDGDAWVTAWNAGSVEAAAAFADMLSKAGVPRRAAAEPCARRRF
jgi:hypothetical protein